MMKRKIGLIVVVQVPREISQYIWFSIGDGAKFEAVRKKNKTNGFSICTRWTEDSNKGISHVG